MLVLYCIVLSKKDIETSLDWVEQRNKTGMVFFIYANWIQINPY